MKSERYTKRQLLSSRRYRGQQDLLRALLEENRMYSLRETDEILKKYQKVIKPLTVNFVLVNIYLVVIPQPKYKRFIDKLIIQILIICACSSAGRALPF